VTLLAGWVVFVHPAGIPPGSRLWFFLPLALCVALVYRVVRGIDGEPFFRRTAVTFANIVVGMVAIALSAWALHEVVLRLGG